MALLAEARQWFEQWIGAAATAVDGVAGRFMHRRSVAFDENADGSFTAHLTASRDGSLPAPLSFRLEHAALPPMLSADWKAALDRSCIEVRLQPDLVVSRLLDFPGQAADFLDGMIRAQVDRLTPWSVADAVFGWASPQPVANDRIEVAFSATSAAKVDPLIRLAKTLGCASVVVSVPAIGSDGVPLRVTLLDRKLRGLAGPNVSRLLRVGLASATAAAAACLLLNIYLGGALQSEQDDLQLRISQRRAALRLDANSDSSGLGLLAKRKQTTPSSVMVLEALSRVLPDTTYVTELRIEGPKVQVVGLTQDAPSLIRLMEQSPQFTRATFFAPTTRAANETAERFHVEADITAYFGSGS
ncbi:fimbrial assembly protein [Bradyrhizobium japonicum]|uniref:Fimbrial assembly protein n=1 Tax=Bradyrhizobium japonicum TaxID=375 RepID=A0A0A3Y0X9_BRAJP|nr:PilN domain-containing protein [Bradyrhizobium japonicum]KGT80357.1 fimbrial assembly protein [Bradyrhizobium japonicum]MCS3898663.1 general secretion pathway protein L [Bradyrhizobium japonicum USDA 38]MCS3941716.1 general secretion pathway protein L [Bradyrhizobium japonicum]MCW2225797.1 general secretion pathway protein L [Bradyrhizobium japonicum]MCW2341008.1 general secretion pathway protein L [Bradyrhizobium japonicum]